MQDFTDFIYHINKATLWSSTGSFGSSISLSRSASAVSPYTSSKPCIPVRMADSYGMHEDLLSAGSSALAVASWNVIISGHRRKLLLWVAPQVPSECAGWMSQSALWHDQSPITFESLCEKTTLRVKIKCRMSKMAVAKRRGMRQISSVLYFLWQPFWRFLDFPRKKISPEGSFLMQRLISLMAHIHWRHVGVHLLLIPQGIV